MSMIIKWTGIQPTNPEANVVTALKATLEGKTVHVDITQWDG